MKTLIEAIREADETEIDACWMCLKYHRVGILRKLKVFSLIFDLDEEQIIEEAPKDETGRLYDHITRHQLHDELIKVSQQNNND